MKIAAYALTIALISFLDSNAQLNFIYVDLGVDRDSLRKELEGLTDSLADENCILYVSNGKEPIILEKEWEIAASLPELSRITLLTRPKHMIDLDTILEIIPLNIQKIHFYYFLKGDNHEQVPLLVDNLMLCLKPKTEFQIKVWIDSLNHLEKIKAGTYPPIEFKEI